MSRLTYKSHIGHLELVMCYIDRFIALSQLTVWLFCFFSFLNLADGHLFQSRRRQRKPALCPLSGCLKSAALCQWPQSWATEQPLGEVQGPSVTHVLLAGGQQRLFQLLLLEKSVKDKQALRARRERWLSHLQPLPFLGLIRPGSKCKASKREQRVNSYILGIYCKNVFFSGGSRVRHNIQRNKKKSTFESVFAFT